MLRWCLEAGCTIPPAGWTGVGATGDASLIDDFLHGRNDDQVYSVLLGAANAGHGAIVLDLLQRLSPGDRVAALDDGIREAIADGGLLHVAQAVDEDPTSWRGLPVSSALLRGHIDFVKWVMEGASPNGPDNIISYAAGTGSIALIRWFLARGWELTNSAFHSAAQAGNVQVLDWLVAQGLTPDDDALYAAAEGGSIDSLAWLTSHGCSLFKDVATVAAVGQPIKVLTWLLDHGCPYDEDDLMFAACCNAQGLSLYLELVDRGVPVPPALDAKVSRLPLANAYMLHRRFGVSLPSSFLFLAALESNLDLFRFGLEHGAPLTVDALALLLSEGECAMLAEVLERLGMTGETRALLAAAKPAGQSLLPSINETLVSYGCNTNRL